MNKKKEEKKENLTKSVRVRYTETQYEKIKHKAYIINMPLGTLIRKLSLENNIIINSKTDTQTKIELRRIGINLNQIAKVINQYQHVLDFKTEMKNLDIIINEIKVTIKKIDL